MFEFDSRNNSINKMSESHEKAFIYALEDVYNAARGPDACPATFGYRVAVFLANQREVGGTRLQLANSIVDAVIAARNFDEMRFLVGMSLAAFRRDFGFDV